MQDPWTHGLFGRARLFAGAVIALAVVTACTGTGGGWLPPDGVLFAANASFGFTFSCERSSQTTQSGNPKPGQLKLELAYNEKGRNPLGAAFSIHGVADSIDPVLESEVCVGQEEQPPGAGHLVFLGRYRLTSTPPAGFPVQCAQTTISAANCRFEVDVQDNDRNLAPSAGDGFAISLTSVTDATVTDLGSLAPPVLFYSRAGLLGGGNITVGS